MAHPPARLPQTEADLADWSVYADALLGEGDAIGERIALELALPSTADRHQIGAVQNRWRKYCPQHPRKEIAVAWTLGHVRTLAVRGRTRLGVLEPIEPDAYADAIRLLHGPRSQRLESIELDVPRAGTEQAVAELLRALPGSCTRLVIHSPFGLDPGELAPVLAGVPAHVTRFALGDAPVGNPAQVHALAARFEVVELARRIGADASWLHPRCTLGEAGLVDVATGGVTMLDRSPLLELQRRHGVITIHAQLARRVPEVHGLRGPVHETSRVATLARRPAGWTLGGDRGITLNGVAITEREVVPVDDRSVIGMDGRDRVFVARDLDRGFRELVG